MKVFSLVLVLIFVGIIVLYVSLGRLVGGEQLQKDKAMDAELQGRDALTQKRPDLALLYFDKGLKALANTPTKALRGPLLLGRGEALRALDRCPQAKQAWAEACLLGQKAACQAVCP